MTLIKSISGIRGTIGGFEGSSLSPLDVVNFTAAFSTFLKDSSSKSRSFVVGRDARKSGDIINQLVCSTLNSLGFDVIDIGLSTTPTVEITVVNENAIGGIIITASHNPSNWNALKLLNHKGEFVSESDGKNILKLVEKREFNFSTVDKIGAYKTKDGALEKHIQMIKELPLVLTEKIKSKKYKIVVDAVNSVGGIAVPKLLKEFGVEVIELYCNPNGNFPHNPEPLDVNLKDISLKVREENADLGLVVDPDVDRLAIVCEDGTMFGEEYTLVAVADYILLNEKGSAVSNLSSSRALKDIANTHSCNHFSCAVGEVNVVEKMKEVNAIIGGEGNGGVIYPKLHYGRDALVGIALFLSYIAIKEKNCLAVKELFPQYFMVKEKVELTEEINLDNVISQLALFYKNEKLTLTDGLKVDFLNSWVHIRKSNTEPILRIYTESTSTKNAKELSERVIRKILDLVKG